MRYKKQQSLKWIAWCWIRAIWRGRWVLWVLNYEDGWRIRHTRSGVIHGLPTWTRAEAIRQRDELFFS